MTFLRSLFAVLLTSATLSACALDDESLGETTSNLSVSSWAAETQQGSNVGYPPASATLTGADYFVYTKGDSPIPGAVPHELYWKQCNLSACADEHRIPDQSTSDRVSLAAFNGYIYMLHVGESNSAWVYFSRLDPTTGQWTPNNLLALSTFGGPPAIAAFNNQLYIVGTSEVPVTKRGVTIMTYPMWYVTMGADEVFSTKRMMTGHESATRPSLASFAGKLYAAHQYGSTPEIAVSTLVPGSTTWSPMTRIVAGPNGTYLQGEDVQIAEANGFLHLVHRPFNSFTYWTYFDQCTWVPEITIDTFQTDVPVSMSSGINGLLLARLKDVAFWPYTSYNWLQRRFVAPPTSITAPLCLPNAG